jgi:hypothetical protein
MHAKCPLIAAFRMGRFPETSSNFQKVPEERKQCLCFRNGCQQTTRQSSNEKVLFGRKEEGFEE